jgi:hypothetical protein
MIDRNNQASWKGCDKKRTELDLIFFTVPISLPRFESLKKLEVDIGSHYKDSAVEVSLPHLKELRFTLNEKDLPKLTGALIEASSTTLEVLDCRMLLPSIAKCKNLETLTGL